MIELCTAFLAISSSYRDEDGRGFIICSSRGNSWMTRSKKYDYFKVIPDVHSNHTK